MIDYTLPLDELPDPLPIEPLEKPFDVTITPPGSKSITCRAYVLAALAEGESKIIRPLRADDTDRLLDALCILGAEARWAPGGEDVFIKGVAGRFPRGGEVNLGDGGTPARFMIAVACLAAEPVVVDGSKRMRERPIAEGVDMLRQLGATIEYVEEEGRLPVRVVPSWAFNGGEIEIDKTQSSQFVSALFLIGVLLRDGIQVTFKSLATSYSYIDLTTDLLVDWDAVTDEDVDLMCDDENIHELCPDGIHRKTLSVSPGKLKALTYKIEPDASSAMYWLAAASLCDKSHLVIPDIDMASGQPDSGLMDMLNGSGPEIISHEQEHAKSLEIRGTGAVKGWVYDSEDSPDGALMFAAMAAVAKNKTHLCGLETLRVKETDRLQALENELTKLGCSVETSNDSITIDPSTRHNDPVVIETYNDHRMAMAFAVLGLARPGISIANPKCVAKSYPGFWKDFAKLYQ